MGSLTRTAGTCEVVEVESACLQSFVTDSTSSGSVHAFQDSPVPPQNIVDISHVAGVVAVQTVVESCTAEVRTEFLISPSLEWLAALKA